MEHLALEIFDLDGKGGSKYAYLPEDTSITITDTSEIFASGDVWSHSFTLNTYANAHIFGTSGEIHGSRLHEQINKRRARLWVEGLPLYLGYLKLDDEVEVDEDGNVDVTFESGQHTFDEMISDAKANQVPMMSDVLIGMALWRKRRVSYTVELQASAVFTNGDSSEWGDVFWGVEPHSGDRGLTGVFSADGEEDLQCVQQYPRMVFPKGTFDNTEGGTESIDCINTDEPYDAKHPYCNVALCYQKQGYEHKDTADNVTTDYSSEPEAQRGYEVAPANRVNSAPNFFVLYWVDALMKHLGIHIEENQMKNVEDLRRLFFVNTKCAYDEPQKLRTVSADSRLGKFKFGGERLVPELYGLPETADWHGSAITYYQQKDYNVDTEESGFTSDSGSFSATLNNPEESSWAPTISHIKLRIKSVERATSNARQYYEYNNSYLHRAFATSECFPDVNISEVIEALESGFGMRLLFSDGYQRVRIVLLRNIFRSEEVQTIVCDVVSGHKTENCIRGFKLTYGESEDTQFYYKGFEDKLPHKKELWVDNTDKHDYSHWNLNADYGTLIKKVSALDKTCYVDPKTGNAYIIKIDENAKRYKDLYPSVFDCAGFMTAEDGDCTGDDETIKTITVGFKPAIMNDVNFEQQRDGNSSKQGFALFVDGDMRPRRVDPEDGTDYNNPEAVYDPYALYKEDSKAANMKAGGIVKPGEFAIKSDMFGSASGLNANVVYYFLRNGPLHFKMASWKLRNMSIDGHINEGYRLYLQDNFQPNDDGVSPLETKDWGLMLGIMRGSGDDATVNYEGDPDDGEGNDTWKKVPGSSVSTHPDICDNYGKEWDYNGSILVAEGGTAIQQMKKLWPNSNINLIYSSGTTQRNADTYINSAATQTVSDSTGKKTALLFATTLGGNGQTVLYTGKIKDYAKKFAGMTAEQMFAFDASSSGFGILIETGSSAERKSTLLDLQKRAFVYNDTTVDAAQYIDNGIGSRYGRFSLKLRAEKPNPYFDLTKDESRSNPRYLTIENKNLRGRGLIDQFYKEYSKFIREARVANLDVVMTLAQFLAIDKTVRVTVGDVTGFIKKMQFTVSNRTGFGTVSMEIMYV